MPRTGLLLARYNQSMHLGQGFNSFLQVSCVDNAVTFDQSKIVVERDASPAGVSQVVSYSSRFVKKISDVVRSMNISAASIIKSGSIEASSSGNPFFVEEAKFASSDLNVVVSVKVILLDPDVSIVTHENSQVMHRMYKYLIRTRTVGQDFDTRWGYIRDDKAGGSSIVRQIS